MPSKRLADTQVTVVEATFSTRARLRWVVVISEPAMLSDGAQPTDVVTMYIARNVVLLVTPTSLTPKP